MPFTDFPFHPIIIRNLALMGYVNPTPVQEHVIEPALAGKDVIGLAQTGTGKTAAFLAPICHHLLTNKPAQRKGRPIEAAARIRALVLCPTRELAQQVAAEASAIAQGSVLRVACVYGKVAISPQVEAIVRGPDIIVGTPGRVRELLDHGCLQLTNISHLAIDEADRMLDMGFLPQVREIVRTIPSQRQTYLFTATMPDEVATLAQEFLRDPIRVEVGRHTTPVSHVKQHLLPVAEDDKVALLLHLLSKGRERGVLVFCRTKRRVGWVGTALERNGHKVGMLHGDRSQAQRQRAFDRFANRELQVLVATDVAARGLHVPAVKTVVNYDLPLTPEEYVHRIGRAAHGVGRAANEGVGEAFSFLDEADTLKWRAILRTVGVEVYAEELAGFKPTPRRRAGARNFRRDREGEMTAEDLERLATPESERARKRRELSKSRRSKKSRPIKKGQLPGGGVRSLQAAAPPVRSATANKPPARSKHKPGVKVPRKSHG